MPKQNFIPSFVFLYTILLLINSNVYSQTFITRPTVTGLCAGSGIFSNLGTISISETFPGTGLDFKLGSNTFTLTLTSDFEFDVNSLPTVTDNITHPGFGTFATNFINNRTLRHSFNFSNNTFYNPTPASLIGSLGWPLKSNSNYERFAMIVPVSEMGGAGKITALSFIINGPSTEAANTPCRIHLAHTPNTSFSSTSTFSSLTTSSSLVFDGVLSGSSFNVPAGTNYLINFDNAFVYNGVSSLLILIETNAGLGPKDPSSASKLIRYGSTPLERLQFWTGITLTDANNTVGSTTPTWPHTQVTIVREAHTINFSGLRVRANNPWVTTSVGMNTNFSITGFINGSSVATVGSRGAGIVNGAADRYCPNEGVVTFTGFPSTGSFVFPTTTLGFFNTISGIPNVLVVSTSGLGTTFTGGITLPLAYTYTGITGCDTWERNIALNPLPVISFNNSGGTQPFNALSYEKKTEIYPVSLSGSPAGGTFTGTAVSGNFFYPSLFPGTLPGIATVTYAYRNPTTGCTNTFTKNFTVFDPNETFIFNPTPPLRVEFGPGKFCVNDFNTYSMTLVTTGGVQTLQQIYTPIQISDFCRRNPSITASDADNGASVSGAYFGRGISVTGSGFGDYNNFKFVPALAGVTSITSFTLNLNYDQKSDAFTDCNDPSDRTVPRYFSEGNASQIVTIYPQPQKLGFINSALKNSAFCRGQVNNIVYEIANSQSNSVLYWYNYTSAGANRQFMFTTSGINPNTTLTSLGISNATTLAGTYYYSVTQRIDGCESDTLSFKVTVKPLPTVPGISFSVDFFCAGTVYNNLAISPSVTTTGYTYKWHRTFPGSAMAEPFSRNNTIFETLTTVTSYFLTTELDGCSSNLLISTAAGSNPTVSTTQAVFNSIPASPTVLGITPLFTSVGINRFCLGSIVPDLSVRLIDAKPVRFEWFTDISMNNPYTAAGDNMGIVVTAPGVVSTNFKPNNIITTFIGLSSLFVRAAYLDNGCVSAAPTRYDVQVVNNPNAPVIQEVVNNIANNGNPLCFDFSGFYTVTVAGHNDNLKFQYNWSTPGFTANTTSPVFNTSVSGFLVSETSFNVFVTDSNACVGNRTHFKVLVNPPVPAPLITQPGFYCTGQTLLPLQAVALTTQSGVSFQWYATNNITSTSPIVINSVLFPAVNGGDPFLNTTIGGVQNQVAGLRTFYANLRDNLGCVSSLTSVNIEIRQTPLAPTTRNVAFCSDVTTQIGIFANASLAGINQYFEWYTGTNTLSGVDATILGVAVSELNTSLTGSSFSTDNTTLYTVRQYVNGCASPLSAVNLSIFQVPPPPTVSNQFRLCAGSTMPTVNAFSTYNDARFTWTNPLGGVLTTVSTLNTRNYISESPTIPGWVSVFAPPVQHNFLVYQTVREQPQITFTGCVSAPATVTVLVFPLPPPPSALNLSPYCSGDAIQPITASGVAASSVFTWYSSSVLGISNSKGNFNPFNPTISNVVSQRVDSVFYVTQRFDFGGELPQGCEGFPLKVDVTVNELPTVNFTGLESTYCIYDLPVTVTGNQTGGIFITSLTGANTVGNSMVFSPSAQIPNTLYTVKYDYTNPSTLCFNTISKNVFINNAPTFINFSGLNTLSGHCSYETERIPLVPTTDLTNFSGRFLIEGVNSTTVTSSAISGSLFIPSLINQDKSGDVRITYSLTINGTSCRFDHSQVAAIHRVPMVQMGLSSLCEGDNIQFTGLVENIPLTGATYKWDFGRQDTANTQNTTRVLSAGAYNIFFKVISANGCEARKDSAFTIGAYPKPAFNWRSICMGDSTRFTDITNTSNIIIQNRVWNFGITVLPTVTRPNSTLVAAKFPSIGAYNVNLSLTTDKNCTSDTTVQVNILPVISQYPYSENFNTTNGSWFAEGNNSDWAWDVPKSAKLFFKPEANANKKLWITNSNTYLTNQDSWINSPCLVLGSLTKPMVALNIKYHTRSGVDGAVLQYSIDDGITWTDVGTLQSGIEWYEGQNIVARPGRQGRRPGVSVGWSNNITPEWKQAKHVLPENIFATNRADTVRFRVAFASSGVPLQSAFDGFALDSFWMGERSKVVLLEQFTNVKDDENLVAKNMLDDLFNANINNSVIINYHTSFPAFDPFNNANPADPSARVLYYGVKSAPTTVFEGLRVTPSLLRNQQNLQNQFAVTQRDLDLQSLDNPLFKLEVESNHTQNTINGTVKITADNSFSADSTLVLQIALVERVVQNEQIMYQNVLRRLIPDAGGTLFTRVWQKGETVSVPFQASLSNFSEAEKCGVIVFLQNRTSRKVYQSAYAGYQFVPVTHVQKAEKSDLNVKIYPNPTNQLLNVSVWKKRFEPVEWTLVNAAGYNVLNGMSHTPDFQILLDNVPTGIYHLKLADSERIYVHKISIFK